MWPFKPLQSVGREPQYRLFSFCLDKRCIENGIQKLGEQGIKIPHWEQKVGTRIPIEESKFSNMQGIQVLEGNDNLVEDYYVFKS